MKKQWDTTQEVFDTLLKWLGGDRDEAGKKYETIRLRLIKIFACRGCVDAEDLADETINRVTAKATELAASYQGDPALYFYGVAQKVHLEYLRAQRVRLPPPEPVSSKDEDESRYECLERCLEELPEDNRKLVLRYYQQERKAKIENRRDLANELGIAVNALRIRAHRIRLQLQECVRGCMGQPQPG